MDVCFEYGYLVVGLLLHGKVVGVDNDTVCLMNLRAQGFDLDVIY